MRFIQHTSLACLLAASVACGDNVFKSTEKADPAEDATVALEDDDPTKAIQILEDALADDEGNPQYLSILALAYAQRAGIEPLDFATRIANNAGTSGDEGSETSEDQAGDMTAMFSLMPEASAPNLTDIDRAVEILANEIPVDQRLPGDDFKLAIYQTAAVVMHMKALDTNGDGTVSLEESIQLSDDSAAGLLAQISAAEALLASSDPNDKSKQKAAQALARYTSQINAAPGSTDEERLRNYMGGETTP
jgi:hypothetical protein